MKRTFVMPEEKEVYYEKFKQLVPEVSGQLVAFIEDYVNKHEALQAGMSEYTVHKGMIHQHDNIFLGDVAKFTGVLIAEGEQAVANEWEYLFVKVYLTKKNKFLVSWDHVNNQDNIEKSDYKIYENYNDMKGTLSANLIEGCEKYLGKNSTIRTYEVLDV